MDSLLNLPHGLMFWTIINFGLFLFLLIKFGGKSIIKAINSREDTIQKQIDDAQNANSEALKLLQESKAKIENAQQEVVQIIQKGKDQAEANLRKNLEEADKIKQNKIEEATKEIERAKDLALNQLRTEVADMVVNATEKIINEKLDKDKDLKLVEKFIDNLPNN